MNGLIRCAECGKLVSRGSVEMEYVDGVFICADCLEDATFICEHCGERHLIRNKYSEDVVTDDGNETWCVDCVGDHAFYCEECETTYSRDDFEEHEVDGNTLCGACLEGLIDNGDVFICRVCDEYHYESNGIYVVDDDCMICEHCFTWSSDYAYCTECGEAYSYEHLTRTRDGDLVCDDCRGRDYSYCRVCGEWVQDSEYNFDSGMCDRCEEERTDNPLYPNAVRLGYHDWNRPDLKWFGRALPSWNGRMRGIGLEIECDAPQSGMELDMQSALNDVCAVMGDRVFFEYDCSLSNAVGKGFEMITQPHTVEEFYNVPWAECFEAIKRYGWSAHDAGTCGLHVHFSREMFGEDADTQDDNIAKLIQFFELYYEDIVKVSRRTLGSDGNVYYAQKCGHKGKSKIKEYAKGKRCGHYSAINIGNADTVEIRIMRGTLNVETFMACIDFLLTIVKNSCRIGWSDTTDDFEWLVGLNPETVKYINKRGAFYSAISALANRGEYSLDEIVF